MQKKKLTRPKQPEAEEKTLRENPWLDATTLRDQFALAIISGQFAAGAQWNTPDLELKAQGVWDIANVMIQTREATNPGP